MNTLAQRWIAIGAALIAMPLAASAQQAFGRGSLNLRAGPSGDYPLVARLAPGQSFEVLGCTNGYGWCDIVLPDGLRGWVYASGVDYAYDDRRVPIATYGAAIGIPIIGFAIGSYWANNYRDRPWYGERRWWRGGPPPPVQGWRPPPPPRADWRPNPWQGPGFGPGRPGGPGGPGYGPQPGYRPPPRPPQFQPQPQPGFRPPPQQGFRPPQDTGFRPPRPDQGFRPPGQDQGFRPPGGGRPQPGVPGPGFVPPGGGRPGMPGGPPQMQQPNPNSTAPGAGLRPNQGGGGRAMRPDTQMPLGDRP